MDNQKWLLLNQLLEDLSHQNFESRDSVLLVSQLVLELESAMQSIRTGMLSSQDKDMSYNLNEELA